MSDSNDIPWAQFDELIFTGHRIAAIKALRELTGCDLHTADVATYQRRCELESLYPERFKQGWVDPKRGLQTEFELDRFLEPSPYIDRDHPLLQAFLSGLFPEQGSAVDEARKLFHFVRDEVAHSADIQSRRVTRTASEVLQYREGICYAKSHLLAALLRARGIPAGICYQRLTRGDTAESGHVIHALNTIYLAAHSGWIRVDARGNKPGIDSQFSLSGERLAYPIREAEGEVDYLVNYPEPPPQITDVLEAHDDCEMMYSTGRLPSDLEPVRTGST